MKKICLSHKAMKIVYDIDEVISFFMFVIMLAAVSYQIIMRLIFNNPPLFTEEISRYAYIWIVFLAMSIAEKHDSHFNISLLSNLLKGKPREIYDSAIHIICIIIYLLLTYYGVLFLGFRGMMKSPALEMPMNILTTSIPVGFGMAALRRIGKLVMNLRK